jgi:hypothetical protein
MSQYDLTDFEWRVIEPLLPNKPRGVRRVDDRRVLNGIFWVLRSGAPWRDLPERYGLADEAIGDDALLGAMIQRSVLIERPLVVTPRGVRPCRLSEDVLELLPPQLKEFQKEGGEVVLDAGDTRAESRGFHFGRPSARGAFDRYFGCPAAECSTGNPNGCRPHAVAAKPSSESAPRRSARGL